MIRDINKLPTGPSIRKPNKIEKYVQADRYTDDILRARVLLYNVSVRETDNIIQSTGLPIRHQNPPEDITENITKVIIRNYENDLSCQWAKGLKHSGDLISKKYPIHSPIEVKAFTSDGPSSFGPKKKFSVIYFLDMRGFKEDKLCCWRVNVSNESPEWKQIKMNKTQTNGEQCGEKRRPHISWDKIYAQIPEKCVKVYDGNFANIFIAPTTESIYSQSIQLPEQKPHSQKVYINANLPCSGEHMTPEILEN